MSNRLIQQAMAQAPQLQVAAPLNDVQLLALVAAQSDLPPVEAVAWAVEIVVEAIMQNQTLAQRIQAKMTAAKIAS